MPHIDTMLQEERRFPPPTEFAARAHIGSIEEYEQLYRESIDDPETFWTRMAAELDWIEPWQRLLDWEPPFARWFVGGKLNASANCLDRHLESRGDKVAIRWEGEPPNEQRDLTYSELHAAVCRFAAGLRALGLETGDRVAIYMPMVPEFVIACLACARLGLVHTVIFAGFSAEAIKERINDSGVRAIVTADGGWRRGKVLELKAAVDRAVVDCPSVEHVIVLRRTGTEVDWTDGVDRWWSDVVREAPTHCEPVALDAEHPLFILYTSGTTGKPKGVLHTTGGYLLGAALTTKYVFDLRDEDIFWCTADVGWITGHSYIVYGPLANGATLVMYEGAPNHPEPDRFWDIVERHRVTIFYTAPTAIRAFMKWGDEWPARHDLSSLRLLGTVGEPINPEAWMWYHRTIGNERCPIVDTWWQTETGSILITPLPGATVTKPGSATKPFFGVEADVVDENGESVGPGAGGLLVLKRPWPSMLRTIYGDDERYREQYWSKYGDRNWYFTGDGARIDEDGYLWIVGRVDDVLNVSGHRLGTAEIESALVAHDSVVEAAVVGRPDEIKGQAVVAFCTLEPRAEPSESLKDELKAFVVEQIGGLARPAEIRFAEAVPKTRSGKIMRRLLKDIASGAEEIGDTTTLEDFSVLAALRESEES
ncbi:MAG: acetate--CoA ligase [Gemmatimonadetes bacterium]|nr:acetate--CoA ligase [Gemmatimonadota bacterium]